MPAKTRAELLTELKALRRHVQAHERQLARLDEQLTRVRRRVSRRVRRTLKSTDTGDLYPALLARLFAPEAELALQLSAAGVMRVASAGARTVLSLDPRDLAGRLIYDCVAEEDRDRLRTRLANPTEAAEEMTWTWPNRVPVEYRVAHWPEQGPIAAVVTLRPKSTGGLRLASAPELAALFAHELNNPLAALVAAAESCRRLARTGNSAGLAELLDGMVAQAERAGEVVRRLRDFAKGARATRGAVPIHEALQLAVADVERELHKRETPIEWRLAPQAPVVQANRTLLGQALTNLVRNAVEAMQATPAAQRCVTIATRVLEREVEIEIMDRGAGISVEGVADLFQPFVSTKSTGTGLGLALTRAIVQAHGGRVWWKDHHGKGASFFVSLPLTPTEP